MITILEKLKNEPAVLVSTVLSFLAYFAVVLPADDMAKITEIVTVLGPIVSGLIIRRFVSPVASFGGMQHIETEGHPGNPLD